MSRGAIASHISSHTLSNLLANFSKVIISGFLLIYVARRLGPAQYGIVSLGLSIAAIVDIFCDFGISTSTARFLAEHIEVQEATYYSGRALNLLSSFIASFVLFLCAGPIAVLVNLPSPIYVQIMCLFTLFTSIFHFSIRSLQGIKETHKIALLNFVQNIVAAAIIVSIVYVGLKAAGVLLGHSAAAAITCLISLAILHRYFPKFRIKLDVSILKRIFFYALPLLLTSSSYFLLLRGPTILLGAFTGTKQVSYLAIPLRIVEVTSLPAYSLSFVVAPFFTEKEKLTGNLQWLYINVLKYCALFYTPIAAFILLGTNRIIGDIFGTEYLNAAPVLFIFAFYIPFFAIATFSSRILDFLGIAKQKSIVFAITAAMTIIASLFVIPSLEERGAALVIAVPYTLFAMYTVLRSAKECNIALRKYTGYLVKLVIVAIVSCIPAFIIINYVHRITGLILSFAILLIFFLTLGTIWKLITPSKIASIAKLVI
jgi:O-antigen/teichoic acid export membrane protein